MKTLERVRHDLVIANRILATEEIVDAYGHVSVRHPDNPQRYLLARSISPELVELDDIAEFSLDSVPISEKRPLYAERFIHGAIYEARPEIQAVIHAHAEPTLPFTIVDVRLTPIYLAAADIGSDITTWDIADNFGKSTDLLVRTIDQARDLTRCLGKSSTILMRGHGFSIAARSLFSVVRGAIELATNAKAVLDSRDLGVAKALSAGEMEAGLKFDSNSPEAYRYWEHWAIKAGCQSLLADQ